MDVFWMEMLTCLVKLPLQASVARKPGSTYTWLSDSVMVSAPCSVITGVTVSLTTTERFTEAMFRLESVAE